MKIIEKFKTNWLQLNTIEYGENKSWDFVSRTNNKKAVLIVTIVVDNDDRTPFKNNKLLITKERRIPLSFENCSDPGYEWSFPAGLIDDNETIEQAAKRELLEETGYNLKKILSISPFVYNSSGLTNESISIVTGISEKFKSPKLEESEEIEYFEMNQREIRILMDKAYKKEVLIGAKAWSAFDHFVRYNTL